MKKIAILDFENTRVDIILVPKKLQNADSDTIEEYIESRGYNLSDCNYMFGDFKSSTEMTDDKLEDRWPLK